MSNFNLSRLQDTVQHQYTAILKDLENFVKVSQDSVASAFRGMGLIPTRWVLTNNDSQATQEAILKQFENRPELCLVASLAVSEGQTLSAMAKSLVAQFIPVRFSLVWNGVFVVGDPMFCCL